ncbi:MAG: glycosyltransferase family 4 protein [Chloroflexi bacterium]|nr:glycosyltransferase family 4 protein [Chloroflexota bacterium]
MALISAADDSQYRSSKPLKIALVSPYDFAYPGGVTSHVSALDARLTALGHESMIIAPSSQSAAALNRPNLVTLGRPVPIPSSGSIARITVSLNLSSKVRAILDDGHFDVIHLHEPLVPALPITFLRLADGPALVGTFHAYASRKRLYQASRFLLERWVDRLDARIAVSVPARDFVSSYFPGTYDVVPNGVDVAHFGSNVEPLPRFTDGKLNILFVGRMEKRKGFPHLLRAYANLKWQFPECRLIAVSPRPADKESLRIIAERGLRDVHFETATYQELPRYYRTADVFCSPATGAESFGITLIEAMAAGATVVASSIPGYRSVVRDRIDGVLIEPRDEVGFAEALLTLLRDADLRERLSTAGRAKVPRFDWSEVTNEVLDVYRRAIAHRRGSPRDVSVAGSAAKP